MSGESQILRRIQGVLRFLFIDTAISHRLTTPTLAATVDERVPGKELSRRQAMAEVTKPKSISKSEFVKSLAEATELDKKSVVKVLEALGALVEKNLGKKGPGVIAIPGLVKIKVVHKKAQPARKGVKVLGQIRDLPAKPASKKVRVLALKGLREMV